MTIVAFGAAITIVNPAFLTVENMFDLIRSSAGMAIIVISDEIPEILHNCNRVLVMREGALRREIPDAATIREPELLSMVSGKAENGAQT